ncbi:hypothetical protein F3Y22_tig00110247pilonHSYRG00034 [Hibiscus syriacus]|uniref:Uncharacterized protein n=1 Tax=Hibiscus syriacus TaxID=106335 RepID=A0A6A3B865_HIBSY|nr:hypothetical protein F3Y22_tig00110247pilonHSYRG00034 [Hibiscus syriacus]
MTSICRFPDTYPATVSTQRLEYLVNLHCSWSMFGSPAHGGERAVGGRLGTPNKHNQNIVNNSNMVDLDLDK